MAVVYTGIIVLFSMLWLKFLDRTQRKEIRRREDYPVPAAFIFGCFSILPTHILYTLHPFSYITFLFPFYDILVTGPVEEGAKFLSFLLLVRTYGTVKEPRDGMVQGAAVGLGFAAVENFLYARDWGLGVLLIRSLLTCAGHMTYASFWGFAYGLTVYKEQAPGRARKPGKNGTADRNFFLAVFAASAFAHGLYNSFLEFNLFGTGFFAAVLFDILLLFFSNRAFAYIRTLGPYRYFSYKKRDSALPVLAAALRLDPDSLILRRRYALHLLAAGKFKAAEKQIILCLHRADRAAPYRILRGAALIGAGDFVQGRRLVRHAAARMGDKSLFAALRELERALGQEGPVLEIVRDAAREAVDGEETLEELERG
jgi:RsiW-degrading membrane proteinase PrsW (M82 family)